MFGLQELQLCNSFFETLKGAVGGRGYLVFRSWKMSLSVWLIEGV